MSEQTQNNNTMVIALAIIAVLLAAIVGVVIWRQSTAIPGVTATTTPVTTTGAPTNTATPPATGEPASTEFDPATATKVPEGMTPEEMLQSYHQDIVDGKYAEAYAMLPLDKQQSYGDAAAYEQQVAAYGITGYEIGDQTEDGDTVTISATQVTPQMPISYAWTFKKVDGQWYVVSREMGGQ